MRKTLLSGQKLSVLGIGSGGGSLPPLTITVPSDYPTLIDADRDQGRHYIIGGVSVTDNDPAKTNTGQTFIQGQDIMWNKSISQYFKVGDDAIFVQGATSIKAIVEADFDLQSKGLIDATTSSAIKISSGTDPAFNTTKKEITGAVNEVLALIPTATINSSNPSDPNYFAGLVIDAPGKTAFTISLTPSTTQSLSLYLNGKRVPETEYSVIGTALTYNDVVSGIPLIVPSTDGDPDELTVIINTVGIVLPTTREIIIAGTDYSANEDNYRTRDVGGSGAQRFSGAIPSDCISVVSMELEFIVSAGAAQSARNIDRESSWAERGEIHNLNGMVDVITTFDFSGRSNQLWYIDVIDMFTGIGPNDRFGLFVDHKSIGGSLDDIFLKIVVNI